jgi:hypothetical protein
MVQEMMEMASLVAAAIESEGSGRDMRKGNGQRRVGAHGPRSVVTCAFWSRVVGGISVVGSGGVVKIPCLCDGDDRRR